MEKNTYFCDFKVDMANNLGDNPHIMVSGKAGEGKNFIYSDSDLSQVLHQ